MMVDHVDLSGSVTEVTFEIFQNCIGPYTLKTYEEFSEIVKTVCKGTEWETNKEQKSGQSLQNRIIRAIKTHGNVREGSQSLRLTLRTHLLQFDRDFKLVNDGRKHQYEKEFWYYAITPSPFKLKEGKIAMKDGKIIMANGSLCEYQNEFKRNGAFLATLDDMDESTESEEINTEEERERSIVSTDIISVIDDDRQIEVSTTLTDIKNAAQKSRDDYKSAEQKYQRSEQMLRNAKNSFTDNENEEQVMTLFEWVQNCKAYVDSAKEKMDESLGALNNMRETIRECNEFLSRQ